MTDGTRITIRVHADGQVSAETHDITGPKCMDYIAVLEDLLDAETVSSAFTDDYTRQNDHLNNEDSRELRQY